MILKSPTLKLIIDNVEANEDGEPSYQNVKLEQFLCEKSYMVNHAVEIVKPIMKCFDKRHDNAISEMNKAAVNVHADEGDRLLLDASRILNCTVWPDSTEIVQYATQLAAFQKIFDRFKEMAIFNWVTSKGIKESFQATIWHFSTYFSTNVVNPIDFWSKVFTFK